jgi:hypothetical protein
LAGGSLCAVIAMLPLRTIEVLVFLVDSATGVVDLVAPLKGTQTYNEAVTKYFAALYVRLREGYLPDEARHAFRTVTLMSVADESSAPRTGHRRAIRSPSLLFSGRTAALTWSSSRSRFRTANSPWSGSRERSDTRGNS